MGETLQGKTWPVSGKGMKARRDFHFTDGKGETVMKATSIWLVIDLETRRPLRVAPYIEGFTVNEENALEGESPKLSFPSPGPSGDKVQVPSSALDLNEHVNNVYYVTRAMDGISEDFKKGMDIKEISINYMDECFLGDILETGTDYEGDCLYQSVFKGEKTVCKLKSRWIKKAAE